MSPKQYKALFNLLHLYYYVKQSLVNIYQNLTKLNKTNLSAVTGKTNLAGLIYSQNGTKWCYGPMFCSQPFTLHCKCFYMSYYFTYTHQISTKQKKLPTYKTSKDMKSAKQGFMICVMENWPQHYVCFYKLQL